MPNRHESRKAPSRWPSHRHRWIKTPDRVEISAREWGNPAGWPIVFVHGLAQSHLSFFPQLASPLADRYRLIAYDLRGHGESGKPLDPSFYNEGRRWADELEAVIDGMDASKPILVGWSLGGRVLRQYLIHYGDRRISGLHFVSARPFEDPAVLAPASSANIAGRPGTLAERIEAHIAFLRACYLRQPPEDEFAVAPRLQRHRPAGDSRGDLKLGDRTRGDKSGVGQSVGAHARFARPRRRADPAGRRGNDRSRHQGRPHFLVRRLRPFPVRRACRTAGLTLWRCSFRSAPSA
jgi:pimeloyl-ACP methyl ester carboxylesterase